MEEKKEVIEEVKEEQVDSVEEPTEVEKVESEVVEPIVDEVPEDEGVCKDLKIDLKTFKEFYDQGGILAKVKQCVILCAIMVVVLYLFRGEEPDWNQFIVNCAIYCGIIILTQVAATILTAKVVVPRQHKKMNLDNLVINAHFTNKGIKQTIEGHEVKVAWEQIAMARETEHSFMFYGMNRSGFIYTKDGLDAEEIQYISSMAKSRIVKYKFEETKKKK